MPENVTADLETRLTTLKAARAATPPGEHTTRWYEIGQEVVEFAETVGATDQAWALARLWAAANAFPAVQHMTAEDRDGLFHLLGRMHEVFSVRADFWETLRDSHAPGGTGWPAAPATQPTTDSMPHSDLVLTGVAADLDARLAEFEEAKAAYHASGGAGIAPEERQAEADRIRTWWSEIGKEIADLAETVGATDEAFLVASRWARAYPATVGNGPSSEAWAAFQQTVDRLFPIMMQREDFRQMLPPRALPKQHR